MAEGFARAYGSDVLEAQSAGLAPAIALVSLTHQVMLEKNIDLAEFVPQRLDELAGPFDLVVNMSGHDVSMLTDAPAEIWDVYDPIGESEQVFRRVRDEIEQRVRELVEHLRASKPGVSQAVASDASRRV